MKSRLLLSGVLAVAMLFGLVSTGARAQDGGEGESAGLVLAAVNIISPDLFITPANGGDEMRLFASSVLNPGETLRSDATGGALITWFYDGTESVLAPESRLTLNRFNGNASEDFTLDVELHEGHMVGGVGDVASEVAEDGEWTIQTPDFSVRPLRGQFELTVMPGGETRLIVTEGRVEVLVGETPPFPVDANQFLVGEPGVAQTVSMDGVTPNDALVDSGICTASVPANLNVRLAPNEDSFRLGGISEGQTLWVRAATEGELWLQVYYEMAPEDVDTDKYGWVYGPAVELDDANCERLVHVSLDAIIYGGFGVDEPLSQEAETDPIATDEATE